LNYINNAMQEAVANHRLPSTLKKTAVWFSLEWWLEKADKLAGEESTAW